MNPTSDDPDLSEVMAQVAQLMAQQAPRRTCTVPGCERKHYGRGLCKTHYMRQARTGTTGPATISTRPARQPTCTVPGCEQPHQARGLCRTHYSRWQRTGDVRAENPPAQRSCGLPGCPQRHYRRGLCRMHFRRWQQAGGTQPAFDLAECSRLYAGGASAAGLGRLYGLTPRAVLDRLRAAGVPIRPPGRQPRHRTSTPSELPSKPARQPATSQQP